MTMQAYGLQRVPEDTHDVRKPAAPVVNDRT